MKKIVLCGFFVLSTAILQAKVISELTVGLAHPVGEFYNKNQGSATAGIKFDYSIMNPIIKDKLYLSFDFGLMNNRLNAETRDFYQNAAEDANATLSLPFYLTVPIMIGLEYDAYTISKSTFFCSASVGLTLFKMTNYTMMNDFGYEMMSFPATIKLGYNVGVGCIFKKRYSFEVSFSQLGNHPINPEIVEGSMHGSFENNLEDQLNLKSVNLTFGYRF